MLTNSENRDGLTAPLFQRIKTMTRPANTERNKDLVLKRVEDPKKWAFRALGKHFRIDTRAAWEIFQRDLQVYASREQVKRYKEALRLSTR